jgi:hypothetical protein
MGAGRLAIVCLRGRNAEEQRCRGGRKAQAAAASEQLSAADALAEAPNARRFLMT